MIKIILYEDNSTILDNKSRSENIFEKLINGHIFIYLDILRPLKPITESKTLNHLSLLFTISP